ncbi:unnamed protein product [Ixodes persulcatus]
MNTDKSVGAWLGDWDLKPEQFLSVTWTTSVSNYLGLSMTAEQLSGRCGCLDINRLRSKVLDWHAREFSFFNRAFICNSVFSRPFGTRHKCVHAPKVTWRRFIDFKQRLSGTGDFERMRRDNLFVSQKKGGLGFVNVELKLKAQRFLFFRDQGNPLVISGFKELGGSFLGPWLEGDTGDFRVRVLKFYQKIAAAKEFFRAHFSDEYLQKKVKKKSLHWDTVDLLISPPLYRSFPGSADKSDVFRRFRRYLVRTAVKNLFSTLPFRSTAVKTWLVKKGFFEPWQQIVRCVRFPKHLNMCICTVRMRSFFGQNFEQCCRKIFT